MAGTKQVCTLVGHSDGVTSVLFSPDGKRIASGSFDGEIRIWNAVDFEVRAEHWLPE